MQNPIPPHDGFELTLATDLTAIDQCIERIRAHLEQNDQLAYIFAVSLVTREALNNAMIHGNRMDPSKTVLFRLRKLPDGVQIFIEDQGLGFAWQGRLNSSSDTSKESGRGHEIYRNYASNIHYNTKGNALTLDITQP